MAALGVPPAFSPCPESIGCPGSDYPIANFSSEAPDQLLYFGLSWPGSGKRTPNGGFWPPLGSNWTANGCFGVVSAPTLEEAQLQAEIAAQTCTITPATVQEISPGFWAATGCFGICYGVTAEAALALAFILEQFCMTTPDYAPPELNGEAIPLYPNTEQTCSLTCPSGSVFTYTARAGIIVSSTQILSDQMAQSYACNQANSLRTCIDPSSSPSSKINLVGNSGWCCTGTIMSAEPFITINGTGRPFVIEQTAGQMPPGVGMFQDTPNTAVLEGQATAAGTYTFQVTAVSTVNGQKSTQMITLSILGLQNSTLPQGTVGTPYSQQLQAVGATNPVTFSLFSGSLPSGLTLASDGTISGNPSAPYP